MMDFHTPHPHHALALKVHNQYNDTNTWHHHISKQYAMSAAVRIHQCLEPIKPKNIHSKPTRTLCQMAAIYQASLLLPLVLNMLASIWRETS